MYHAGVKRRWTDEADVSYCAKDRKARAFAMLDRAFTELVAAFERSEGRPLTPSSLPQARPR